MNIDIDEFLEKWFDAKQQISINEKKIEKYKRVADKLLQDRDTLQSSKFQLKVRNQNRETLSKNNVPREVWDKYSSNINYNVYYLLKNKK